MLTKEELWKKAGTDEHITAEDIGLPSWRSECDGFEYELSTLHPFCRSGIAYRHKDGYRWLNGSFFTARECKIYDLEPGVLNK